MGVQAEEQKPIKIYAFTQQGCPYCAQLISFLETQKNGDYPQIQVEEFDLKNNPGFIPKFNEFARAFGTDTNSIPKTFIGDKIIDGFRETELRSRLEYCSLPVNDCGDSEKIVKEKLANLDDTKTQSNSSEETLGWVVIGVIVVAAGGFLFYKIF
jgi:hypothetical protein